MSVEWERLGEEPDRERRLETILTDAYGDYEQLWAFYTYWEEHAEFPFEAVPRSQVLSMDDEEVDTMPNAQAVEVVKVSDATESRGVLCQIMQGEKTRQVPISEFVPLDSHNRRVWGDYIVWFDSVLAAGSHFEVEEEEIDDEERDPELEDEEEE